jgi:hypothetical protein
MMHPIWRLEHDWIHRNRDGQLDALKKSVVYCKKIHIRSKSVSEISLHAIKDFFEQSIEPKRLDQMRQIRPDASLLKASLDDTKSNVLGILNKHNEIMLRSSEILFQQNQLERAVSESHRLVMTSRAFTFSLPVSPPSRADSGYNFRIPGEHVTHSTESEVHREAHRVSRERG